MTNQRHTVRGYVVEGHGDFPFDMLRYDVSTFESAQEATKAGPADGVWGIEDPRRTRRKIVLQRDIKVAPRSSPCADRWTSFGWTVIADEREDVDKYKEVLRELREPAQLLKDGAQTAREFRTLRAILSDTYDLTGKGTVVNSLGADVQHPPGPPGSNPPTEALVTGYELVRRLELAHRRIRTLRLAISNSEEILDKAIQESRP